MGQYHTAFLHHHLVAVTGTLVLETRASKFIGFQVQDAHNVRRDFWVFFRKPKFKNCPKMCLLDTHLGRLPCTSKDIWHGHSGTNLVGWSLGATNLRRSKNPRPGDTVDICGIFLPTPNALRVRLPRATLCLSLNLTHRQNKVHYWHQRLSISWRYANTKLERLI